MAQLLKRWNDWSAGIGHLVDDGRTPGMYYSSGLLGLRGELRPAPFFNVVTTSVVELTSAYTLDSNASVWSHVAQVILPATSGTPVVVSGSESVGSVTNNTTLTYSHTVPSGSNRIVAVMVTSASNADPTGITFDGDALTKIGTDGGGVTIWRRVAPTETTGDVVVTYAGATDLIAVAITFVNAHQSTPEGTAATSGNPGTSSYSVARPTGAEDDSMLVDVIETGDAATPVLAEPYSGQTSILDETENGTIRARAGYATAATAQGFHWQYFIGAVSNFNPRHPFLYASRGDRFGGGYVIHKIDLENATFSTFEASSHAIATTASQASALAGQSAKYEGLIWFPNGSNQRPRQLSVVGDGDASTDTLVATATPFVPGADHLTILGDQLVGVVKESVAGTGALEGTGTQDGGVRILKVGGNPATAADWGDDFPAGDVTVRAAGLITLGGLTFVMNVDGLYSFNSKGRSGIVFEDFRDWQNIHLSVPLEAWGGGIVIPHPSGLLFYTPGEEPVDVGLGSKADLSALPTAGTTELHSGLHHSASGLGSFLYSIFAPDLASSTVLVACGYSPTNDPTDLIWQGLGTAALQDVENMAGIKVVPRGRPVSDSFETPTVWFGSGPDLNYIILDPKASPFRSRASTHKVNTSADAYMSELRFTEPVDLTGVVIHTSRDMLAGDEFQIKIIANGASSSSNVGSPVRGSGTRHERTIDRTTKVTSLVLHVNWAATSAASRVPPAIQSIELYGKPSVGGEEQ